MKLNEVYGGNYLKAEDIRGKGDIRVEIESVSIMDSDDGKKKAVLHFRGKDKCLPLNITNANMVAEMHGEEMDEWEGKRITLHVCKVDFQGKRVDAIRVKEVASGNGARPQAAAPPPPPPPPVATTPELTDDDIPF